MRLRKLLSCLLIGAALILVFVPSVHAQTSTSITIVAVPSQVPLQSDGTAQFDVTAQVTAVEIPKSTLQNGSGDFEILVVGLGFLEDEASPNLSITGSAVSSPDFCMPPKLTGGPSGYTVCMIVPFCQFASSCSATDDVTFHATLNNARTQQYHLTVMALFILQTPQAGNSLGAPVDGTQGSSWNTADFHVSVGNQASNSQVTTTATYGWLTYPTSSFVPFQMPKPTPTQPTNYTPELVLVLVVIAAVVLFLYTRRKGQPQVKKTKKPADAKTKKAVSGKNYCIECGSELPLKSKFCNNCGTKQP